MPNKVSKLHNCHKNLENTTSTFFIRNHCQLPHHAVLSADSGRKGQVHGSQKPTSLVDMFLKSLFIMSLRGNMKKVKSGPTGQPSKLSIGTLKNHDVSFLKQGFENTTSQTSAWT